MKFGIDQIGKQSPQIIVNTKNALNYLSATIVAFIPSISSTFGISVNALSLLMGLSIIGINFIGLMFGVPVSEKSMPTSAPNDQEIQHNKLSS